MGVGPILVPSEVSLRSLLRAILAVALLLGSGLGDWLPAQTATHEACCCGMAADANDTCPCPKPENSPRNNGGTPTPCAPRGIAAALAAPRSAGQLQRRIEPRPEPATWARAASAPSDEQQTVSAPRGREPDLGRHLAGLSLYRI